VRITLFRLFGIPVRLDASWFVVVALIAWSLATGAFPALYPNLPLETYWLMGIAGTIGLFASIVVHEFFHALVARRHAIPMQGITLFIFGGVAEMGDEPTTARAELAMAAAGPIASIVLCLMALGVGAAARGVWPVPVAGVISYVGMLNGVLAVFNLLPAFPLDGGRVLRAALWTRKKDLRRATETASRVGRGFSVAFMAAGVLGVLAGNVLTGAWWILIGLFLQRASTGSYEQVVVRQALEGEPVTRFMDDHPITVPPELSLAELVDSYIYRHHFQLFPVVEGGHLLGCVTTADVKRVPRDEWAHRTVGSVFDRAGPDNTIASNADALRAMALMRRTGQTRAMVADNGHLLGVVTMKDLLEFFALKAELGG